MKTTVKDAGDLRRYRTEIPNLIDDADLSVYAFRLYVHLKRVAGDSGTCWKGERTLAEDCRISRGKVRDAKEELVKAGFIVITAGDDGESDRILITNIWAENMETYFHEGGTRGVPPGTHQVPEVVHHIDQTGTPRVPKEETQEEVTQEEKENTTARKRASVASRVPDNFTPTPAMLAWASEHAPDVNPELETEAFRDYWRGVPDAKGRKLDWEATWRNRMRDIQKRTGKPKGRASPEPDDGWKPKVPTLEIMAVADGISIEEARKRYAGTGIIGAT